MKQPKIRTLRYGLETALQLRSFALSDTKSLTNANLFKQKNKH